MHSPFRQHRNFLLIALFVCSIILTVTTNVSSSPKTILVLNDGVDLTTGHCGSNGTDQNAFTSLINMMSIWLRYVSSEQLVFQVLTPDCEDVQSAALQLMNAITDQNHNIVGVLTVSSPSTAQGIADIMKSIDVPLVQMATGNDITGKSTNENHFIFSHYMQAQLSVLLDTVDQLNWESLCLDSNNTASRKHLQFFLDDAIRRNLCILPDTQSSATPRVMIHPYTYRGTPEFGCFENILYNGPAIDDRMAFDECSNNRTILALILKDESWSNFCLTFLKSSFKNNANYRRLFDQCSVDFSANANAEDMVMTMGSTLTAMAFLLQHSNLSLNQGICQNNDITKYACSVLKESKYELDSAKRLITGKHMQASYYVIEIKNNIQTTTKQTFLSKVPSHMRDRKCEALCDLCFQCISNTDKASRSIYLSRESGDLYIVGFFPLHKSSTLDECDVVNPLGQAQAVAFLHTVNEMSKSSRSSRIRQNLRGAVVDSCNSGIRISSIINSIQFCTSSWIVSGRDNEAAMIIQPATVLGYFTANSQDMNLKMTGNQRIVSISKSGYSSSTDIIMGFMQRLLEVLMRVEWTVLNVIVSPESIFQFMSTNLKKLPISHKFCFVTEILINAKGSGHSVFNSMHQANRKSTVFLLLMSEEDTFRFFNEMNGKEFEHKMQFIFTPWNEKLQESAVVQSYTDVNVIFQPLIDSEDIDAVMSMKTSEDFSSYHLPGVVETDLDFSLFVSQNQIDVSLVVSAVRKFFDAIENAKKIHNELILPDINVDSSGLVVIAEDVEIRLKKEIAQIGDHYKPMEFFISFTHTQCKGWCPECHVCREMPEIMQTYFHKAGDVIITGLLPLHEEGSQAFQCGRVQNNQADLLHVLAFLFAIETFHMRYPESPGNLTIGGLVLDSCSNALTAAKAISDFETCRVSFAPGVAHLEGEIIESAATSTSSHMPSAYQNLGYVVIDDILDTSQLKSVLSGAAFGDVFFVHEELIEQRYIARAILDLVTRLGWTHTFLLSEDSPYYQSIAREIITRSSYSNVCVVSHMVFETRNEWRVERSLEGFEYFPVVLISRKSTSYSLFDWMGELAKSYFWIISAITADWVDFDPNTIPVGSVLLTSPPMENDEFAAWLQEPLNETLASDWLKKYWEYRYSCQFTNNDIAHDDTITPCSFGSSIEDSQVLTPVTSHIIRTVDAIFQKVQNRHQDVCSGKSDLCPELLDDVVGKKLLSGDVSFYYQGEKVEVAANGQVTVALPVLNLKPHGVDQVGYFFKSSLNLTRDNVSFFYPNGSLYHLTHVLCRHRCSCIINANASNQAWETLPSYSYRQFKGEFLGDLWAIIVSSIAGAGALVAILLICYVLYKVCKRAIGKRFVGLGLLLLVSLAMLYISVLPFVLSAHDVICGLRFLFHSVAFALVFAGILVKLMTIQSYKIIGLGGEISSVNQFITVFFIVGVQIAISVQWWVYNSPMVIAKLDMLDVVKYTCAFDRPSFAYFHSYLAALLLICSVYSIAVRKEKRNMGEAKLLMISCWICVVLWIAWGICFFVLDRDFSDLVTCAAILSCATTIMLVVFVPKMKMVAGLKYSISHKDPIKNGYTIDTDFLYERPFSLPGTLSSTFSTTKISPPKPLSHFNSDVNY